MRQIKLYDWESVFDFGQCKGQTLIGVYKRNPSYISWCFQSIDWFCITDEIFEMLPIVISLKKDSEHKDWLKMLNDKHSKKKEDINSSKNTTKIQDNQSYEEDYYSIYRDSNYNWLEEASGTDDPETMNDVYWNLD